MAPALASASAGTDSIKGLAQSVARPAYRRLLGAEPALRRAVPILIIAFLCTMAIGAIVQINDERRLAVASASRELDILADLIVSRFERETGASKVEVVRNAQDMLDDILRQHGAADRTLLISDSNGVVIATSPKTAAVGRALIDTIGESQALTT